MSLALDQIFVHGKRWLLSWIAGTPNWVIQLASSLINIVALLAVFLTLFALISVLARKIFGRMQNRYGPNRVGPFGLFQPVADGIKMLIKEDIVPARADKIIHFLAPVVLAAVAILTLGVIPYGRNMSAFRIDGGILFFFAVGSATELAVFMAGWASNNKFSMLGAMRAIAQMFSYELPLIITVLPVVMVVGSLMPDKIVVPEGESEIVAGHMTEYSGFKYATFFLAEYLGMFAVSGLAVTLFLGGWHAPARILEIVPFYVWFFLKLSVLLFVYIWLRATLPRTRVDQMMNVAWKFMLPMAFTCVIAAAVWHYAGRGVHGWLWSLFVIVFVYSALSILLDTRRKFARRVYRFAE